MKLGMKKKIASAGIAMSFLFGGIACASSPNSYIASDSDTFWSVSQKLNISLTGLMAANPAVDPLNMYGGLALKLPGSAPQPFAGEQSWEKTADAIIATGMTQLGVPYVFGGSSPGSAFDCSGFVQYAFNLHGFDLLHSAELISRMGTPVAAANLRKGDLVFLEDTYKSGVSHVAIYLGDNKVLQASTMGAGGVQISTFHGTPYYDAHYWGARRLIQ